MKKILYLLTTIICFSLTSCNDDEWGNGDPAMEHVYYFGFEDWGKLKNDVVFNATQGETLSIPVEFHSERVRSYDVIVYYYVSGNLVRGKDYEIVDENGSVLSPEANGAFSITWPQAKKGVKNIYVKTLQGDKGAFNVLTFDPNDNEEISYTHTTNNLTGEYEVRTFTQNYKVTVNIK